MTNSKVNNLFAGQWPVTLAVWLMRMVVGAVFIFSGWAKAIDPWGSYYKFNEYLLTLGWDSLVGLSLFGAFAVPCVELALGVLVLVGAYRRSAPVLLLLLMLVMLPLTLWLAVTDAVPDCGCFGDALKMSNWGTFGKNVALTMGIVFLLVLNKRAKGLYGPAVQWLVAAVTIVASLLTSYYGYFTQPLVDFRPYKVGTLLAADPGEGEDDFVFVYSKDGKEQEFGIDSLPDEADGWEFVDRRPVKRATLQTADSAARQPVRLPLMSVGMDVSDQVLASGNSQLLILFSDLKEVNIAHTFAINELVEYARNQGTAVYGVAAASESQIAHWNDISMADYDMLTADDSDIKMIARGNPAVVFIDDNTIVWKRTLGSIDLQRLRDPKLTVATLSNDFDTKQVLSTIMSTYLMAMAFLLVFNRLHVLLRYMFVKCKSIIKRRSVTNQAKSEQ